MSTPAQKAELNAAPKSGAPDTSSTQGEPVAPAMTPRQAANAFAEAKARAEGIRQSAMLAARRAFEAAGPQGAPKAQAAYDEAIKLAEIEFYRSAIAAAERFGIHSGTYRVALSNLSAGSRAAPR